MSMLSTQSVRLCLGSSARLVRCGVLVRLQSSSQDFEASCKILGIEPTASLDEVKLAFRELSMRCHPDKSDGSREAHDKFQAILEAYDVITKRLHAQKVPEEVQASAFIHKHHGPLSTSFDDYIKEVQMRNRRKNRQFYSEYNFKVEEAEYFPQEEGDKRSGSTLLWACGLVLSVVLAGAGLIALDKNAA